MQVTRQLDGHSKLLVTCWHRVHIELEVTHNNNNMIASVKAFRTVWCGGRRGVCTPYLVSRLHDDTIGVLLIRLASVIGSFDRFGFTQDA